MPAPFPHRYSAMVCRDAAMASAPEQMVLTALGQCLLTTFEAFAARDGIVLLGWESEVSGVVERTPEGLMFTSIVLCVDLCVDGDVARVEQTLEDAKQYCLVLNSLRVPVVVEAQIQTADDVELRAS
jgi:organic hydroperoxide reductase OsmC/OhrA